MYGKFRSLTMMGTMAAVGVFCPAAVSAQQPRTAQPPKKEEAKRSRQPASRPFKRASFHGGEVTPSREFCFETVFAPDGLYLYLYDAKENPMHWKHWQKGLVKGDAIVSFRGARRKAVRVKLLYKTVTKDKGHQKGEERILWSCPRHPAENGAGPGRCAVCKLEFSPQDYLYAGMDLKDLAPREAKATVHLKNLPGRKEKEIRYGAKNTVARELDRSKAATRPAPKGHQPHEGHSH